jgi:hypothetical protein
MFFLVIYIFYYKIGLERNQITALASITTHATEIGSQTTKSCSSILSTLQYFVVIVPYREICTFSFMHV